MTDFKTFDPLQNIDIQIKKNDIDKKFFLKNKILNTLRKILLSINLLYIVLNIMFMDSINNSINSKIKSQWIGFHTGNILFKLLQQLFLSFLLSCLSYSYEDYNIISIFLDSLILICFFNTLIFKNYSIDLKIFNKDSLEVKIISKLSNYLEEIHNYIFSYINNILFSLGCLKIFSSLCRKNNIVATLENTDQLSQFCQEQEVKIFFKEFKPLKDKLLLYNYSIIINILISLKIAILLLNSLIKIQYFKNRIILIALYFSVLLKSIFLFSTIFFSKLYNCLISNYSFIILLLTIQLDPPFIYNLFKFSNDKEDKLHISNAHLYIEHLIYLELFSSLTFSIDINSEDNKLSFLSSLLENKTNLLNIFIISFFSKNTFLIDINMILYFLPMVFCIKSEYLPFSRQSYLNLSSIFILNHLVFFLFHKKYCFKISKGTSIINNILFLFKLLSNLLIKQLIFAKICNLTTIFGNLEKSGSANSLFTDINKMVVNQ